MMHNYFYDHLKFMFPVYFSITLRVGSFLEKSNTGAVVTLRVGSFSGKRIITLRVGSFSRKRVITLRVGSFSWKRVILEWW